MKDKNHPVTKMDRKDSCDIQHPFVIKIFSELDIEVLSPTPQQ